MNENYYSGYIFGWNILWELLRFLTLPWWGTPINLLVKWEIEDLF
jgi:hypothetical protein